jgi:hypothetical protein
MPAAHHMGGLGIVAGLLYPIAQDPRSYHEDFNDITIGNNAHGSGNHPIKHGALGFSANPGYHLATGLGTPNISNLLDDLEKAPARAVAPGPVGPPRRPGTSPRQAHEARRLSPSVAAALRASMSIEVMERVVIALVLAFGVALLVSATASPSPSVGGLPIVGARGATAALSDPAHGARPVALTLRLRAELQCGRFNSTSITVSLPTAMRVPASVSKSAVTVAGKAPASIGTSGTSVLIHPAPPKPGVTCDVIGPGVVVLKFTRLADLGNPMRAGSYPFNVVAKPGGAWHGVLAIQ